MPTFNKGASQAEAAAKSSSPGRADWLSIKSGTTEFLRPYTDLDEIITADIHMGVPTKPAPKGMKPESWAEKRSAVCRNGDLFKVRDAEGNPTEEFETDDKGHPYGDCYIHANMTEVMGAYKQPVSRTKSQTWGLFIVREPVQDGGGKLTGFKDKTEEYKDEAGKVHHIPKIVMASQSYSNFWAAFKAAGYMTGTICDVDFSVGRTDNDYTITRGRETPDHKPGTPSWQRYDEALALKGVSVEHTLLEQSSWEYYGRFFDPSWTDPDKDGDGDDTGDAADAAGSPLSDEEAAAMKAKMAAAFSGTQPT